MERPKSNVIAIDPYSEGRKAFFDGKSWEDCPYARMPLSPHFFLWMSGWDDASLEPPTDTSCHANCRRKSRG